MSSPDETTNRFMNLYSETIFLVLGGLFFIGLAMILLVFTWEAEPTLKKYKAIEATQEAPRFYIWWEETRSEKTISLKDGKKGIKKGIKIGNTIEKDTNGDFQLMDIYLSPIAQITSTKWEPYKTTTWAAWKLPREIWESIPHNDRIETKEHTAAWRLLINWQGDPLRSLPRDVVSKIIDGKLPRPQKLSQEEHDRARAKHPGVINFGLVVWEPYGKSLIAQETGKNETLVDFQLSIYPDLAKYGIFVVIALMLVGIFCICFSWLYYQKTAHKLKRESSDDV